MSLHSWQYADYADFHGHRGNLWIHLFAVPWFLLGNLLTVVGWLVAWWLPLVGLGLSAAAFGIQGAGHAKETNAPKPFTGPWNVVGRMFVEQWVTFPRFLVSGGWWRALRAAE